MGFWQGRRKRKMQVYEPCCNELQRIFRPRVWSPVVYEGADVLEGAAGDVHENNQVSAPTQ